MKNALFVGIGVLILGVVIFFLTDNLLGKRYDDTATLVDKQIKVTTSTDEDGDTSTSTTYKFWVESREFGRGELTTSMFRYHQYRVGDTLTVVVTIGKFTKNKYFKLK